MTDESMLVELHDDERVTSFELAHLHLPACIQHGERLFRLTEWTAGRDGPVAVYGRVDALRLGEQPFWIPGVLGVDGAHPRP